MLALFDAFVNAVLACVSQKNKKTAYSSHFFKPYFTKLFKNV